MIYTVENGHIIVTDDSGRQWKAPLMADGCGAEMTRFCIPRYMSEFTIRSGARYALNDALRVTRDNCLNNVSARLYFTLTDGTEAAALKVSGDTYIMLDCIGESVMDSNDDFNGTYEESELRCKLQGEYLELFPQELRDRMVPWENGDLLRLPKAEEIFTNDELNKRGIPYDESVTRLAVMEDPRNRIAMWEGMPDWYWCENKASASYFANCSYNGGVLRSSAPDVSGVRPVFRLS